MDAQIALERLKDGNLRYVATGENSPLVTAECRNKLVDGQHPYAVVVGCADSRIVPETAFNAGLGELFVVRLAGNVVDEGVLGSILYATQHLGVKLVVVLGHEGCGAVHAALCGGASGYTKCLTDKIVAAIGDEREETKATILNVGNSVKEIEKHLPTDVTVVGALYRLQSGKVDWLI